jgi:excisionase family DNA binding protein
MTTADATAAVRFLTLENAARRAGVSVTTIRRLVAAGKLTPLRPSGRRVVIDAEQLDRYVLGTGGLGRSGA